MAARIRGTRAAADETNSDVIDDCSVDRKRDNCRSDVARQRKAIRTSLGKACITSEFEAIFNVYDSGGNGKVAVSDLVDAYGT
ncbi:hypothetical protein LXL04_023209 [Taraxacum kok-saghyz]